MLQRQRLRQRLTLEEAAKRCGLSLPHLNKLERNRYAPTIQTLTKLTMGLYFVLTLEIAPGPSAKVIFSPAEGDESRAVVKPFGPALRQVRKDKNCSQLEIAYLSSFSLDQIGSLENNKLPKTIEPLLQLSHVLEVTLRLTIAPGVPPVMAVEPSAV